MNQIAHWSFSVLLLLRFEHINIQCMFAVTHKSSSAIETPFQALWTHFQLMLG